ncbi:LacI family DNA-binding transcriptional regulator [Rhizobiaceae sp. 2RAB30]
MNKAFPTIQDVARVAKVSTATVSRALSAPERVSEDTRRQVIEAIERTGYAVNQTARNLRRKQTGAVVVLVPNLGNPFFSRILAGIETTASKSGLNVLIADTRQPHAGAARLGEYLHNNRADGMIVLDGSLSADFFSRPGRPPVVFCCEWNDAAGLPSVRCDNAGGAALAVHHLHQLGHRRIGHILGPSDNVLTHERRRGTEAALAELALPQHPDWIFAGDFSLAAGARAGQSWLALAERPTAVTFSNDEMACGFIAELHRHGVSVPADVSVVGFDDIDIAEQFIPALTTIHQPRNDIGEAAAAALIARIGEGKAGFEMPEQTKVLGVELVVRASTRSID